jgi:hypothetical protein
MRGDHLRPTLAPVTQRVRFVLEIEGSRPIGGSLKREGGMQRSFTGWLELMALVNDDLDNDRSVPATLPARPTDQTTNDEPEDAS